MSENRYYLIAEKPFQASLLEESLEGVGLPFSYETLDERKGLLLASEAFAAKLSPLLYGIHEELGTALSFLSAPKESPLLERLLPVALSYFPNKLVYLTDCIFKELSFGNFSSLPLLKSEFKTVPEELLLTVGAYLRSGLNASLASETLYIHRNTFLYRYRKWMALTGLDIREYHNALLLELYFSL